MVALLGDVVRGAGAAGEAGERELVGVGGGRWRGVGFGWRRFGGSFFGGGFRGGGEVICGRSGSRWRSGNRMREADGNGSSVVDGRREATESQRCGCRAHKAQ